MNTLNSLFSLTFALGFIVGSIFGAAFYHFMAEDDSSHDT